VYRKVDETTWVPETLTPISSLEIPVGGIPNSSLFVRIMAFTSQDLLGEKTFPTTQISNLFHMIYLYNLLKSNVTDVKSD